MKIDCLGMVRSLFVVVAGVVLAGCAALQVDVDVYKGPLASTDETQNQQLASVALTAKPLISIMRNRLIVEGLKGWPAPLEYADRSRHIGRVSWERMAALPNFPKDGDSRRLDMQRAGQLNAILSFYESRDGADFAESLKELEKLEENYQAVKTSLKAEVNKRAPATAGTVAKEPGESGKKESQRLKSIAKEMADLAKIQLSIAKSFPIRTADTGVKESKLGKKIALTVDLGEFSNKLNARFLKLDQTATFSQALNESEELKSKIEKIAEEYRQFAPNDSDVGFDRGRSDKGIEELADELAQIAFSDREERTQTKRQKTNRLETAQGKLAQILVDFGARMQFLATNLWIVDSNAPSQSGDARAGIDQPFSGYSEISKEHIDTFRALLETVANTIMVQADELRVKGLYDDKQEKAKDAERAAVAVATGKRTRAQEFDSVLSQIKSQLVGLERLEKAKRELEKQKSDGEKSLTDLTVMAKNFAKRMEGSLLLGAYAGVDDANLKAGLKRRSEFSESSFRTATATLSRSLRSDGSEKKTGKAKLTEKVAGLRTALVAQVTAAGTQTNVVEFLQAATGALNRMDFGSSTDEERPLAEVLRQFDGVLARQYKKEVDEVLENERAVDEQNKALQSISAKLGTTTTALLTAATSASITSASISSVYTLVLGKREDVVLVAPDDQLKGGKGVLEELRANFKDDAVAKAVLAKVNIKSPPPFPALDSLKTASDVMDALIAQLEHQRIEELAANGEDGGRSKYLALALAEARQRRATMTFVRPSSAYLRSALVSTFAQTGTSQRWQNMLNDGIGNFLNSVNPWKQEHADIRDNLDKAYWQNINTVRVSAAGSTNYVLAKDDVGNWYVKAMGADPKAMINAAKNLALFNAGGKFNANLLRMNQLQTQLDEDPNETASDKRVRWTKELESLSNGSGTFGATAERGTTLRLFKQNYETQTAKDLKLLTQSVDATLDKIKKAAEDQFTAEERKKRVVEIITGSTPSFGSVTAMLTTEAAGKTASEVILDGLTALNGYRIAVVAKIGGESSFVEAENLALKTATSNLKEAEKASVDNAKEISDNKQAYVKNGEALATLTASISSTVATPAQLAEKDRLTAEKQSLEQRRGTLLDTQLESVTKIQAMRDQRSGRENDLITAQKARAEAAGVVDRAIRSVISEIVNKRLRAIQELETAANVVGRRSTN